MFPIKQLNQPPNDSFHRHLGNYRSLLFTSGDETAWVQPGWGVGVGGVWRRKQRVRSEWMKTKRQGWRAWGWSGRCNELNLTVVNGLVQEKPYFPWLKNEANKSLMCKRHSNWQAMWGEKKQKQWKYTAYDLLRRRVKQRMSKGLYGGAWIKMQDERLQKRAHKNHRRLQVCKLPLLVKVEKHVYAAEHRTRHRWTFSNI